jgi:hypothetical protein
VLRLATAEVTRLSAVPVTDEDKPLLAAAHRKREHAQKKMDAMESVHKTNEQRLLQILEHYSGAKGPRLELESKFRSATRCPFRF